MAVPGFAEIRGRNRPSAELSDHKRNDRSYLNALLLRPMKYRRAPKVMVADASRLRFGISIVCESIQRSQQLQGCADEFLQIDVALVVHLFVNANRRAVIGKRCSGFQRIEEFLFRPFGVLFVF